MKDFQKDQNQRYFLSENIRQGIYAQNRVIGLYCVQKALNTSLLLSRSLKIDFNFAFVLTPKSAVKSIKPDVYSLQFQFL